MIYIHVPFCRKFCAYCSFYSELAREGADAPLVRSWLDGLSREISARAGELLSSDLALSTLYIGGGTPSVLPLPAWETLFGQLARAGLSAFEECTVEANPEDLVTRGPDYVPALLSLGVNRFSIGVQSLSDPVLKRMNRRHDAAGAREAFRLLRRSGADNISVDLIFGIRDLSDEVLLRSLDELVSWGPEHVSAYQLTLEPDSAWGKAREQGMRDDEAPEEVCARQYGLICERLAAAGYLHYEISNWARPGREARHNSAYWRRIPYAGLGPAAHSLRILPDGRQQRCWNAPDLHWISKDGTPAEGGGSEWLTPDQQRSETLMLGLRTAQGIDPALLDPNLRARALAQGLLETCPDGRVRIPEARWFVSDGIVADLV